MRAWTNLCYREYFCKTNCWKEVHFEFSCQNLNRNVQSPSMWWWLIPQPRPIWKKAPPGLQRQKNHTAHHPKVLVLSKSNISTPWTHPTMPLGPGAPLRVIYYKLILLLETISCKLGQICATGNAFVRLTVGRNSILNFPAKIWTGMCRPNMCSVHIFLGSQSERGGARRAPTKRLSYHISTSHCSDQ